MMENSSLMNISDDTEFIEKKNNVKVEERDGKQKW